MKAPMTSGEVIELLRARYDPPAFAFLEQVGDRTGAYTSRHVDAIAMSLYPSRGLELYGFEVKVARADWRKELRAPDKAEAIAERCDRWFVVAPADIVPLFEVPAGWGLIEVRSGKLVQTKEAPKREPLPLDHGFLAAILRRASLVAKELAWTERMRIQREATEPIQEELKELRAGRKTQADEQLAELTEAVRVFEEAAGVSILPRLRQTTGPYYFGPSAAELGRLFRYVVDGGGEKVRRELEQLDRVAERIQSLAKKSRDEIGAFE